MQGADMDGSGYRRVARYSVERHANPGRSHQLVSVDRVLLAEPRGFCAGVEMAIKALTWMVNIFEAPVYCYHEIVHNEAVVEAFEMAGVIFVDHI